MADHDPHHVFYVDGGPGTAFLLKLRDMKILRVSTLPDETPAILWSANAGEQVEALLAEHVKENRQ